MIQRLDKTAKIYLLVPADKYGAEFYQDLVPELHHMKLKLHHTLWLGAESELQNHLRRTLKTIADDLDKNTSYITFLLGFLYPNDFRFKKLFNATRTILGERFGKILWILPAVHPDFSNEFILGKDFQALEFEENNPETVSSDQNLALWLLLDKTSRVLENCYRDVTLNETLAEHYRRNLCFQETVRGKKCR